MDSLKNKAQIREELLLAKQSRLEGNEGRARVCARRAAGIAVSLYLEENGLVSSRESFLESLIIFRSEVNLPERIKTAISWLVQRVDKSYNLPADIDLIDEAKMVLDYLDEINHGINGENWG